MKTWMIIGCALFLFSNCLFARNYPCSGSKGGVSHCQNGKFVCNDGSLSASKKTCDPELYKESSFSNENSEPTDNQTKEIRTWVDSNGTTHFSY
ncbi:hypothetical protein NKV53_02475 [Legionella sp. 27cVA30]|uniref:YdcA family protein n=1 Tax=Legionella sp. 27cVA30 TaxID=2905657 RepID=UPI00209E4559|nr:hypothetical protein [Legionella sp. 27cVA30]MCP0913240.1 hypothetical protein [Legionella sp. 27cVA30]